jgi:chromosomal replication initiator protein
MADKHYLDELANLWISVKESFKDKNGEGLSDTTVSLWFDDVKVVGYEEQADDQGRDILTLGIENPFKYRQIQNKFLDKINKAFNDFLGFEIRVILVKTGDPTSAETFSTPIPKAEEKKEINPIEQTISDSSVMPIYNFEYTFENFIVGGTNTFAHAACLSIANNPFANNFNPLFIYVS